MIIRELITKWGFEIDDGPLNKADAGVKTLTLSLAAMTVALGGATAALGFFLKKGGELEQTNIAFETMLGSAEKGKQLFADLAQFTKATPFELKDTLIGAKRLLAYNIEAEKIIPTLTALGNIAAGVGREKLPFLILALGQVRTATKLRGQELRQFSEAGVPLIGALAEKFGLAEKEIFELVSRGEVGFKDVEEAIIKMTSGSGKFADLMQKQSKSFLGILSIIRDTLNIIAIEIGSSILPMGKKYAKMVLDWVNANEKMLKLKMVEFFKKVFKVIERVVKILRAIFRTVMSLVKAFGGLNKMLTNTAKLMGIVFSIAVIASIGKIIMSVFALISALHKLKIAGILANIFTFGIPLLIGAAFLALLGILEDIHAFLTGKGSLIEDFFKTFAKPEQIERFRTALKDLARTLKELAFNLFDAMGRLFGAEPDDKLGKQLDENAARLETFVNLLERAIVGIEKLNELILPDETEIIITDPTTGEKTKKRFRPVNVIPSGRSAKSTNEAITAQIQASSKASGLTNEQIKAIIQAKFAKEEFPEGIERNPIVSGLKSLDFSVRKILGAPPASNVTVNAKTDANPQEIANEVEKVIVKQNREARRDTAGIVEQ